VFKNWRVADAERDALCFAPPANAEFRHGADFGYAIDPSVLVRCFIVGRTLYVDREAYMIGCEIVNLPDLFDRVPGSRQWFITADSSRPETISYLRSHGFPKVNASIKGAGSVEEGIAFLQSFDIVVHPDCRHTLDELASYSYQTDSLTGEPIPRLEDRNNHVIDALRYACEGARRAAKVGQRHDVPIAIPVARPMFKRAGRAR
jgi:phage terminase large subunit